MILEQLQVYSLRSFKTFKCHFHPNYNYIIGDNAAGKTTLLEAIYLLGSGHSFKTREISPLIQHGHNELIIYGKGSDSTLSISKSLNSPTIVKIDRQPCHTSSQLAYLMPCQVYYQDIFHIMDSGPSLRRAMIDWGMFHVKHEYLGYWKQYKQILKQRNSLLKQRPKLDALKPWDSQLAIVGEQIASMREKYIETLKLQYEIVLSKLTDIRISLNYEKGWDKKQIGLTLEDALKQNQERDIHRGYTSVGIHHADILLDSDDNQAKKVLSRGQQKIALISLKLCQSQILNKHCVHLMDDVFAELDRKHQENLANYIKNSADQFFLTVLSSDTDKLAPFPKGNTLQLPYQHIEQIRESEIIL